MYIFIVVIKILAIIFITTSHYDSIYPEQLQILGTGGMFGNVLFFLATGFLLRSTDDIHFFKWFFKKMKRIYPSIWIFTIFMVLFGVYKYEFNQLFSALIYPTEYHFIASLIILLIPCYLVLQNGFFYKNIKFILLISVITQFIFYIFYYDKSYYHIDVVEEWMVRFLFFNSLLLGINLRKNLTVPSSFNYLNMLFLIILFPLYIISSLIFRQNDYYSVYQITSPMILLLLLWSVSIVFSSLESIFRKFIKGKTLIFLKLASGISLEIYIVQFVVIRYFNYLIFPINFFVVTALIIISAYILFLLKESIIRYLEYLANIDRKRVK